MLNEIHTGMIYEAIFLSTLKGFPTRENITSGKVSPR